MKQSFRTGAKPKQLKENLYQTEQNRILEGQNSFIAIIEYLVCDKNRKHLQCMSSVNKLRSQVSKCLK